MCFNKQQAQHYFRRRLHSATAAALRMSCPLRFVHRVQKLLVVDDVV
jgi:hypothetical protein